MFFLLNGRGGVARTTPGVFHEPTSMNEAGIKPLLDVERSSGSARQACARMAAAARKFTRSSTSRRFGAGLGPRRRHPSAIEHDEPEGETGVAFRHCKPTQRIVLSVLR